MPRDLAVFGRVVGTCEDEVFPHSLPFPPAFPNIANVFVLEMPNIISTISLLADMKISVNIFVIKSAFFSCKYWLITIK